MNKPELASMRPSDQDEREAFKKAYEHLDLHEIPDPWGVPMFFHSHVEALWEGWSRRAAKEMAQAGLGVPGQRVASEQKLSDDLMLIRSVLRGYPSSFARADALAAVDRLATMTPEKDVAGLLPSSEGAVAKADLDYENEHPAAKRMRLEFEAKYGRMSPLMQAANHWFNVRTQWNEAWNRDREVPTTEHDVAEAERAMLAAAPGAAIAAREQPDVDALRAEGWAVAVHNDYRLNGEPHTFWLFTKGDRAVKGEGRSDAEALAQVRAALASPSGAAKCKTCNGHGLVGGLMSGGWGYDAEPCPDCGMDYPPLPEGWPAKFRCDSCEGNGEVGDPIYQGELQPPERARCSDCDGRGWTSEEHAFNEEHMREYLDADRVARAAPLAPPVAYYNSNWTLTPREYKHAEQMQPPLFLDMKPAYAHPFSHEVLHAIRHAAWQRGEADTVRELDKLLGGNPGELIKKGHA